MRNQSTLVIILAAIGAIVVLGWVLRIAFDLFGVLILIAVAVAVYFVAERYIGKNR